jgi:Uma2 family endonuclease
MIAHSPSAPFPKLSPEEYLQWEERQREKHECFDGEIYAINSPKILSLPRRSPIKREFGQMAMQNALGIGGGGISRGGVAIASAESY